MAKHHVAVIGSLLLGTAILSAAQAVPKSDVIDAAQLLKDLQTLSADDMEGRQVGTPGSAKARAYVVDRFKESGLTAFGVGYERPFTFVGRGGAGEQPGVNVVGWINGSKSPARYLVVTAHYDHLGSRGGQVFNGADDNASGTAALFALAKYFSVNRPAHSLILAALDAEEVGLHGATAFVRQPPSLCDVASEAFTIVLVRARMCLARRTSIFGLACLPRAMTPATSGADDDVPPKLLV